MMTQAISLFLPILEASPWFGGLSNAFRDMILGEGAVVRLQPMEPLFLRGDAPDGLYAVLQGAVEIGAVDADGNLATLTIAQVATWFGEIAVVDRQPRTHNAIAVETSTLLRVPQARLLSFLERQPESWRELSMLLTEKLRLAFAVVEDTARLPALRRIAARLVMIAEGYGGASQAQTDVKISQSQLGAMLNISRQTVNQGLRAFEASGLIVLGQARIIIADLDGLRGVCEGYSPILKTQHAHPQSRVTPAIAPRSGN